MLLECDHKTAFQIKECALFIKQAYFTKAVGLFLLSWNWNSNTWAIQWGLLYKKIPVYEDTIKNICDCLFGVFLPTRVFFTHLETSPLPMKGFKFWHTRHSWPFRSEGSLTCHTYCDTSLPSVVISEGLWHPHI